MQRHRSYLSVLLSIVIIISSCILSFSISANSVNENGDLISGLPVNGRIYRIYTLGNRVFDVMNAWTSENSTVWTYPYSGAACQEWQLEYYAGDYALKDTNSGKYLTVKDSSSADGAELVITEKVGSFSSGQLFKIEQHGTSMRYKLKTKCSNYNKAICSDGYYLKQMPSSDYYTQMYFTEAAVYHGIREGRIHIQAYNSTFNLHDRYIGCIDGAIDIGETQNTHSYDWNVQYQGHGYFTISNNGLYLGVSNGQLNRSAMLYSFPAANYCLWKITVTNDRYTLIPKASITGNTSTALGVSNNTLKLLSQSSSNCQWRIIREHYYYPYYATIYAAEDYGHYTYNSESSHGTIFQSAVPSFYLRGFNNQKLIWQTGDTPPEAFDIIDLMQQSRVFVFRGHGSPNSILLNAKNANGASIGSDERITISNINALNSNYFSSTKLCVFLCCYSANGAYQNPNAANIVNAVVGKGCSAAIGFDGEVDCNYATTFSNMFFEYYSQTVGSPDQSGKTAFELLFVDRSGNAENNKPFFKTPYISLTSALQ